MAKNIKHEKKGFISIYKIQLLIITAVVFLLYIRTIYFGFVGLDDKVLILDNYSFISDIHNIKAAFLHHVFYNPKTVGVQNVYYRPLLTLSLMFDAQFSAQSPIFYHFSNILFHLISCIVLFRLLVLLRLKPEVAFCGAILFAVHPVLSQAIGWIPGRNDSMLTLFSLASLIYFIQFLETNNKSNLWFHILFFALAIYTKETAALLPVISLVYYILIYKPEPINLRHKFHINDLCILMAGYLLVLFPWFLFRENAILNTPADLSLKHLSESFISNLPTYLLIIQKLIAPYNLSTISTIQDTNFILGSALIALIIGSLVFSIHKRWRYVLFGFIWFNIFLLPGFMVPILTGFEHRVYLPLIGFLIIVLEIDYFKNLSYIKPNSFVLIGIIIVAFIVINFNHTSAFSNKLSFWKNAATNSPKSSMAKLNYGEALAEQGRKDEAIKIYKEGLAINPSEPMIHNNLGILYGQQGMFAEAEKEFKEETIINPTYSDAYYNLGTLYKIMGRKQDMLIAWKKALLINPNNTLAQEAYKYYYAPSSNR